MSHDDVMDKDKGGRPPEGIKYGQHKNHMGWDPTGGKTVKQVMNTTFQPDPRFRNRRSTVATENADILKKINSNGPKVISEQDDDIKKDRSMLEENNIL